MFSIPVTSFRGQHRAGHERVTSVWYGIKIGRVSSPYFNAYRLVTSDPEPGMRLSRAHLHDGAAGADPATRGRGGPADLHSFAIYNGRGDSRRNAADAQQSETAKYRER